MNFKAALTTLTLGLLVGSPAMALDPGHELLVEKLVERDVLVAINPPQVCNSGNETVQGVYFYSTQMGVPALAVCQDNAINSDVVVWTSNDLDTLRHEAFHYIQDCMGGVDGAMDPFFDGPGGLSTQDVGLKEVIKYLGQERALAIINRYTDMGADEATIILELEAFLVASMSNGEDIAELVVESCPIQ